MPVINRELKRSARWVTCFAVAAVLGLPSLASAGEANFTVKATVTITGEPLGSFDISWVDPDLHAYLLADRSNKAVDVINTTTKGQSKLAPGAFRGVVPTGSSYPTSCPANACNGPNGVLSFYNQASGKHEVWAGDGPTTACPGRQTLETATTACSTVKVIDFATGAILHNIATGGQYRADELCYDPADHLIQIANDSDLPFPYINYIPTEGPNAYKVVKQIQFDGQKLPGHGPAATNGIEQCQWNLRNGLIYLNLPEVAGDGNDDVPGHTVLIDPRRMEIVGQFIIPIDKCAGPQGMAIGPGPEIMLGCNAAGPPEVPAGCDPSTTCAGSGPQNTVVINEWDGSVIKTLANQGGNDEVWFNPGNGLYFLAEGQNAGGEQLGIVSAFPFIQTVQDVVVASPPGTGRAHSVAADPISNEVYLPIPDNIGGLGVQNPCPTVADGCVAIYSSSPSSHW
jgi:hypothetical protein